MCCRIQCVLLKVLSNRWPIKHRYAQGSRISPWKWSGGAAIVVYPVKNGFKIPRGSFHSSINSVKNKMIWTSVQSNTEMMKKKFNSIFHIISGITWDRVYRRIWCGIQSKIRMFLFHMLSLCLHFSYSRSVFFYFFFILLFQPHHGDSVETI